MSKIIDVEGIGETFAGRLGEVGIHTDVNLLERGSSRAGRAKIAGESGISEKLILRWVNHVNLFRINGVQAQYAELLEAAGVDSVPELARRNPANLMSQMAKVNDEKHLVRKLPSEEQISGWIDQAKSLPRAVTH